MHFDVDVNRVEVGAAALRRTAVRIDGAGAVMILGHFAQWSVLIFGASVLT